MKTRIIGDIHGKWMDYLNVIHNPKSPCSKSIQVGDFGVGFGERAEHVEYVQTKMNKSNHSHRFIRGNHDNPETCKTQWKKNWIPDGLCEDNTMFVGGALSIDKHLRTPGVSWWEDEELSYKELSTLCGEYDDFKPKIMITHECPESIATSCFSWYKKEMPSRTRNAFESMFAIHKPELWIFGHWHVDMDRTILGTRFICLNELSHIDIDFNGDLHAGEIVPYKY